MNVDFGIWGKLTRLVIILFVAAGLMAIGLCYVPLIQQNERLRKENLRLSQEIQKEEEAARRLKTSINALQRDPKTIERLAREKLGLAKPGETVIRFEIPVTNTTPVRNP
jgi:cell division protein FtsB